MIEKKYSRTQKLTQILYQCQCGETLLSLKIQPAENKKAFNQFISKGNLKGKYNRSLYRGH